MSIDATFNPRCKTIGGDVARVLTESDLVMPALLALSRVGNAGLSTADLQPILRDALLPAGEDLLLLEGRTDDRFSQKVRNLRSHQRLERDDLATFDGQRYRITNHGRNYMAQFGGVDKSLSSQGFGEASKKDALASDKPLKFVEEGQEQQVTNAVRRRSRRLRDYAFAYYADSYGKISCVGCAFEATQVYGSAYTGLIEIHHTQPIALAGNTFKPLAEAVADVVPICPTCHRVVHANVSGLLSIEELQELIQRHL